MIAIGKPAIGAEIRDEEEVRAEEKLGAFSARFSVEMERPYIVLCDRKSGVPRDLFDGTIRSEVRDITSDIAKNCSIGRRQLKVPNEIFTGYQRMADL